MISLDLIRSELVVDEMRMGQACWRGSSIPKSAAGCPPPVAQQTRFQPVIVSRWPTLETQTPWFDGKHIMQNDVAILREPQCAINCIETPAEHWLHTVFSVSTDGTR